MARSFAASSKVNHTYITRNYHLKYSTRSVGLCWTTIDIAKTPGSSDDDLPSPELSYLHGASIILPHHIPLTCKSLRVRNKPIEEP